MIKKKTADSLQPKGSREIIYDILELVKGEREILLHFRFWARGQAEVPASI